jgi:hypothetical protein
MEELHGRFRQRNFARPLEAAQKIKFDTRQAATRPIDRGHDLRGSAVCVNQLRVDEKLPIMQRRPSSPEDLYDGIRSRSQRRHVAKTDDLVYNGSADIREHGAQCHLVRVDIRNQGNTRRRNDLIGISP